MNRMTDAALLSTEPPPYYADEEPRCFCSPSTPWDERKYNGTFEEGSCEMRTCPVCVASLTRLVNS